MAQRAAPLVRNVIPPTQRQVHPVVRRSQRAELGRPAETVRGWLRRFTGRIEAVRVVFTGWCRALAADPVLPGPAGSAWADAIAAATAAACALGARFGAGEVLVWAVATVISNGRLLAPGWPGQTINTSCP